MDDEILERLHAAATKHKHKVGQHVKTPHGHGHVASVHTNQTFYGVNTGAGVAYYPGAQVEPVNDDTPGIPDADEGTPGAP